MTFIKWVGGKKSILKDIIPLITMNIKSDININYYEPFIGGGSILIELLNYCEKHNIHNLNFYASDINERLINLYKNIKNNVNILIDKINEIIENYDVNNKLTYYELRDKFNSTGDKIEQSSLFIILNKTCWRGVYRENKNKVFNTPFGNYKNPRIYSKDYLLNISTLFNKYNVLFENQSYNKIIPNNIYDIIYLDPPYLNTYDSYTSNKFDYDDFNKYIELLLELGIFVILSNSIDYENELFDNNIYININDKINSKTPNSIRKEIILYNW